MLAWRCIRSLTPSLQASRKLHERMAFAIFRSPMNFFETTPAGRILNRFSRYVSIRLASASDRSPRHLGNSIGNFPETGS
jgi:ABC-type multidrug transport system fused ATPase/permease subunit